MKIKKVCMAFIGVFLCSVSIVLFKLAAFGTDPFTSFMMGVWNIIDIPYDILYTTINSIILTIGLIVARKFLGIATLFTIFLSGFVVEKGLKITAIFLPNPNFTDRFLFLILAVILMCFSSSLYYTANLGVSSYDVIALFLADKKVSRFRYCRILTDSVCVFIGFILGTKIGIGTIITTFLMGPLIEWFNKNFSIPFLNSDKYFFIERRKLYDSDKWS